MASAPVTPAMACPAKKIEAATEPTPAGACKRCEREERSPPNATHRFYRRPGCRGCAARCRGGQGPTCNRLLAPGRDRARATMDGDADARRIPRARGRYRAADCDPAERRR